MSLQTNAGVALFSPEETKRRVDASLRDYFTKQIHQADAISPSYGQLWRSIAQLSDAGGKRLRPHLLLTAYRAFSNKPFEDIFAAAISQELLHLAMLIHDDIIDRDYFRYGTANVAGQYQEQYSTLASEPDKNHFADSAALLAGDLLISQSHALLQTCSVNLDSINGAQRVLAQSMFAVAGGELLDTEAAFVSGNTRADAVTIARYKTASYSFVGPLLMGAQLAQAAPDAIQKLEQFGQALGIAYQLQDDLLGVFGDGVVTGKSVDGDIREGKRTYLIEQFYALADNSVIQQFERGFHNSDATTAQLQLVRDLLESSGAKQATIHRIEQYSHDAQTYLDALQLSPSVHDAFSQIINVCTRRSQ